MPRSSGQERTVAFDNPEYETSPYAVSSSVGDEDDMAKGEEKESGGNGGLVAFVVVVALLALAALAVGLTAIINPNLVADLYGGGGTSKGSSTSSSGSNAGGLVINVDGSDSSSAVSSSKTYTIAIGNSWAFHEFIGSDGRVQGFSRDYANAVCSAGGLSCRVVVDKYTNCWQGESGGDGLFGEYYDGCLGWLQMYDRLDAFDFTDEYLNAPSSYFFVKPGRNFDSSNLADKIIGFRSGWSSGPECLGRQSSISNNRLDDTQIRYADTTDDLVRLLTGNVVDAIFIDIDTIQMYVDDGTVSMTQPSYSCAAGGNGVMVKKTCAGDAFLAAFNAGFKRLRESGGFAKLCADAVTKYGLDAPVPCA